MNVEDRIARAAQEKDRNERLNRMRELLEMPPLEADSLDTVSLALRINDQQELIGMLANSLAQITTTVLELRSGQGKQQLAIEALADMVGAESMDQATGLVGFDKPKIELN